MPNPFRALLLRLRSAKQPGDVVGPFVWDLVATGKDVSVLELTCSCAATPRRMILRDKGKTCFVYDPARGQWLDHQPGDCVSLLGLYEDCIADQAASA